MLVSAVIIYYLTLHDVDELPVNLYFYYAGVMCFNSIKRYTSKIIKFNNQIGCINKFFVIAMLLDT